MLREYIVSEAMHALGIPATRALAAVVTGDPVYREHVLPGAVFTRVAASHVRVGTFQFFAARGDHANLRVLADYVIDRHYPDLKEAEQPYVALLKAVSERQASLIARWLGVGFIHGVMNTDNMTISGETIDFGPCAFMDAFDPAKVFSSIDQGGRYGYSNQPGIGQWNLARLFEAMLPILNEDTEQAVEAANGILADYGRTFQANWLDVMRRKIGLSTAEDGDLTLVQALLARMNAGDADFTLTFRRLSAVAEDDAAEADFTATFRDPQAITPWLDEWRQRLSRERTSRAERATAMRAVNPAFIPRNHRIEEAIKAAVEDGDFSRFEALLEVTSRPYEDQPNFAAYAEPPKPGEEVLRTFCGT